MIYKKFDQGWKDVAAAEMQNEIIEKFLHSSYHDNSLTVLINNTWFLAEFDENGSWLGDGNKFKNTVEQFIDQHKDEIDTVFVYCLVDPAWSKVDFPDMDVVKIGYYPGDGIWIDLHALIFEKHFYTDSNLDTSGTQIDTAFLCYNGKPRPHREELVKRLIELDLVKSNFVTFSGNSNISPIQLHETHQKKENINADPFDAMTLGDIRYWNRHFLNVVTETVWDIEHDCFWSEKVFKPIVGKRPFLIYAPNGGVNLLAEHGFQDYTNDFKDISDLDLTDPKNIPEFLATLNNQNNEYFQRKYQDLQEKINFNYQNFYNYTATLKGTIDNGFQGVDIGLLHVLFDEIPKYNTRKISFETLFQRTEVKQKQKNKIKIYHDVEWSDNRSKELSQQGNYCVVGSKIGNQVPNTNTCFFSWHVNETAKVNKKYLIDIPQEKKFLADILLGNGKHHRLDFFDKIKSNQELFNACLINLHREENLNEKHQPYSSPALEELENTDFLSIKQKPEWASITRIKATNYKNQVDYPFASQVVPEKIYQNSWITVLFESIWENDHFFPTEKIAKPIIAGRIFMASSGKNYLASLRDLGFKTFSGIIDENYDTCNSYQERNSAILKELERLNQLDMSEIYRKAQPILEHNQNLIYTDFQKEPARKFLLKIIKNHG